MRNLIYKGLFSGVLCAATFGAASAQQPALSWRPVGPDNMGTRTSSIAYAADGSTLFLGSLGAGLFTSSTGGQVWQSLKSYNERNGSFPGGNPNITDVVVNGSNIYVVTGAAHITKYPDGQPAERLYGQNVSPYDSISGYMGDYIMPGEGVYVSTDGGATWSNDNATKLTLTTPGYSQSPFASMRKILVVKGAGTRIFLATAKGVYYSDDNLATVTAVGGGTDASSLEIFDIEEGSTPNEIYATTAMGLFRSDDGGSTFAKVTGGGLPLQSLFAARGLYITISKANRNKVYIAGISNNGVLTGVFLTEDKGETFTRFAPPEAPGFTPLTMSRGKGLGLYKFVFEARPDNEQSLIIAGNAWYSYTPTTGWTNSIQTSSPDPFTVFFTGRPYLPAPITCIAFNPAKPAQFFVGTEYGPYATDDAGVRFANRGRGLTGNLTYSVTSSNISAVSIKPHVAVMSTSADNGILYNGYYRSTGPIANAKGFGQVVSGSPSPIFGQGRGKIQTSYTHPGALLMQSNDMGMLRSSSFGNAPTEFYGAPDPLILTAALDVTSPFRIAGNVNAIIGLSKISTKDTISFINRECMCPKTASDDGLLGAYEPSINTVPYIAATQYVISEHIPAAFLSDTAYVGTTKKGDADSLIAVGGIVSQRRKSHRDTLQSLPSFLFFASSKHIWRVNNPFLDASKGLPTWTRITDNLLQDKEVFTCMTAAGDENHTFYIGTSRGNLFRIQGADSLGTVAAPKYNGALGAANVKQLSLAGSGIYESMKGRTISDIAIDPTNPARVAISYAGYGESPSISGGSYLWVADNGLDDAPVFSQVFGKSAANEMADEQIYALEFVPNKAGGVVLLAGTQSGLYATSDDISGLTADFLEQIGPKTSGYGRIPVMDIYRQQYRAHILNELTQEFALTKDNTVFVATLGRGVWTTSDLARKDEGGRTGENPTATAFAERVLLYPNPATDDVVSVGMNLDTDATVKAELYDISGRRMLVAFDGALVGGAQVFDFSTNGLQNGVYFLKVASSDGINETVKLVIAK